MKFKKSRLINIKIQFIQQFGLLNNSTLVIYGFIFILKLNKDGSDTHQLTDGILCSEVC